MARTAARTFLSSDVFRSCLDTDDGAVVRVVPFSVPLVPEAFLFGGERGYRAQKHTQNDRYANCRSMSIRTAHLLLRTNAAGLPDDRHGGYCRPDIFVGSWTKTRAKYFDTSSLNSLPVNVYSPLAQV